MDIIKATNIHRKFGEGKLEAHILKGIDITVKQGEFIAIMGKSGAGKSTLMYQLSVLDEPTEGTVIIDNVDVIPLSESESTTFRLNTLGYVFQNYALVPDLSAEENVMLPLLMRGYDWNEAKKISRTAIDGVGMHGKYTNLPAELSVANSNESRSLGPLQASQRFYLLTNLLPISTLHLAPKLLISSPTSTATMDKL